MLPFYESQLEEAVIALLEESGWDYTRLPPICLAPTTARCCWKRICTLFCAAVMPI